MENMLLGPWSKSSSGRAKALDGRTAAATSMKAALKEASGLQEAWPGGRGRLLEDAAFELKF